MRFSYFAQAVATSAAVFTSSASAFDASANNNLVVYWGQGSNQSDLSVVCDDLSVDVVVIGFINQFPATVGDYPGSNFGQYHHQLLAFSLLTCIRKCL